MKETINKIYSIEELKTCLREGHKFENEYISSAAANEYARYKQDCKYKRFRNIFAMFGRTYLWLLLYMDKEKIDIWLNELDKSFVFDIDFNENDSCKHIMRDAFEFYTDYYLEQINVLIDHGYALGVISELIRRVLDEDEIRRLMRMREYTNI